MHKNDEGGDGKEDSDCFVGTDGAEVDFTGVYHEHRTPILSVLNLSEMLTVFPKYCVAFLVFS